MATITENPRNVCGATLSRRQFVKTGGALVVGVALVGSELLKANLPGPRRCRTRSIPLSPTLGLKFTRDSTILIRTGKSDFGQGTTFTAYRQIVADELRVPFEAITTIVAGDTDRTPTAVVPSISLAAERQTSARPPRTPIRLYSISRRNVLASRRTSFPSRTASFPEVGRSISYSDLVKDQQLKLTIPVSGDLTSIFGLRVEGNPPMKPVSEYTVIGKSLPNSIIRSKVCRQGNLGDRRAPSGQCCTRAWFIRRRSARLSFPSVNSTRASSRIQQVYREGKSLGVVSSTEWEAIQASQQVAAATKWTDWKGLPGNANLRLPQKRGRLDGRAFQKSDATTGEVAPRSPRRQRNFRPPINSPT